MAENKSGLVLVNKPEGVSSNKVVNIVKHALGAKKCGHLGTLDLEGAGLLIVTVNSATKLFDFFLNKSKTYETVFVFGFETDTLDLAGKIVKEKPCKLSKEEVGKAAKEMVGDYDQMPPQYSAKKVNGKIAYKEARSGRQVELRPKRVSIFSFKLLKQLDDNKFKFEICCSSGTYIRSICRDLAEKLSTYGSMQCILRTRCGSFSLEDAYSLEDVKNGNFEVLSCESLFDFPKIDLEKVDTTKLLNGQFLKLNRENGEYKLFDGKTFLGIGEIKENVLRLKLRLI